MQDFIATYGSVENNLTEKKGGFNIGLSIYIHLYNSFLKDAIVQTLTFIILSEIQM